MGGPHLERDQPARWVGAPGSTRASGMAHKPDLLAGGMKGESAPARRISSAPLPHARRRWELLLAGGSASARRAYSTGLQSAGFRVTRVGTDDSDAGSVAPHEGDAIVLLAGTKPAFECQTICIELRRAGCESFILVVASSSSESEHIELLRAGADDVIGPRAPLRLVAARLEAGLRRAGWVAPPPNRGAQPAQPSPGVHMTRIEERLLGCLLASRGAVVPFDTLFRCAWPCQRVVRHTLHVHLSALREKLGPAGYTIKNVRRKGYSLRPTEPPSDGASGARHEARKRLVEHSR